MIGTDTDVPPRRTDRKHCTYCEASAAGCRSNAWLRGRNCCEHCTGNHDLSTPRERQPMDSGLHPSEAKAASDSTMTHRPTCAASTPSTNSTTPTTTTTEGTAR